MHAATGRAPSAGSCTAPYQIVDAQASAEGQEWKKLHIRICTSYCVHTKGNAANQPANALHCIHCL